MIHDEWAIKPIVAQKLGHQGRIASDSTFELHPSPQTQGCLAMLRGPVWAPAKLYRAVTKKLPSGSTPKPSPVCKLEHFLANMTGPVFLGHQNISKTIISIGKETIWSAQPWLNAKPWIFSLQEDLYCSAAWTFEGPIVQPCH